MKDRLQVLGSRFQKKIPIFLNFPSTWHLAPGTSSRASRGFTLLLAALVGSIVLALGSAVFGIAVKQVTLSSIGKNSQFAFYAADTAAECALFWDFRFDLHPNTFATSSAPWTANPISCAEDDDIELTAVRSAAAATTTFTYDVTTTDAGNEKKYCAIVSVAKVRNPSSNGINTVIRSNGYSNACADITTARDTLERAVQLRY